MSDYTQPDEKIERLNTWGLLGLAIFGGMFLSLASGVVGFSLANALNTEPPAPTFEDELEILPPLRTGITREQAHAFLHAGTLKQWKEIMSPESHIAVCRLAAYNKHSDKPIKFREDKTREYVLCVDRIAYTKDDDSELIIDCLVLLEQIDILLKKK